jgi:thiamine biosynthesis lipoprotein
MSMNRLLATLCATLPLLACAAAQEPQWHVDTQRKMGTQVQVQVYEADPARAAGLLAAAMAELDRIEAKMSTYREDSEISRVNREAAQQPVPVSRELFDLVARSLELSRLTGGAFDITYDSVGQYYSFRDRELPSEAELSAGLPAIDWRLVELDPERLTIRFLREGVRINLGGIAKGYACEQVIALLREAGIERAMANAGGDTRILGDRGGKPWVVGIRDPDEASGVAMRLALTDEAISTSGDYERYFVEDGVRYHHILDPGTGRSVGGVRSVSVIGPDATLTDGLSTSVFVLGPDRGLALIDELLGYEAVIIDAARRIRYSTGLQPPP